MAQPSANRKRLFKLLAVANRELGKLRPGWCEDDYRLVLQQCGAKQNNGRFSASTMTDRQMEEALRQFKVLGFKTKRVGGTGTWRTARINKLNAMWCALADAGVVRDRSSHAMEVFCRRQINGLTRLQWATSDQLNQAVEMLKGWCVRVNVEVKGQ